MSDFKLKILGVRGSRPICDKGYLKYGGNTFCVEILVAGLCLIFDAGTGIGNLKDSSNMTDIHLFFTHYHIDHIMGLYYFKDMYDKNKTIHFYGFNYQYSLEQIMNQIFSLTFFPLKLEDFAAKKFIKPITFGESIILNEKVVIQTFALNHPGRAMAYSVCYNKKKVTICTDTAPIDEERIEEFYKFVDKSDYLIFDSYFLPEQVIPEWGHSSYKEALDIMRNCEIGKVLLIHFSEMTDESLDQLQKELEKIDYRLILSQEGMYIEL